MGGKDDISCYEVLYSNTPLSFWGGICPTTGNVIDHSHPLYNSNVKNKVLCIPSGRGSCTGSQVMLELILNKLGPKAIIFQNVDLILCTGAVIAEEFFPSECEYMDGYSKNVPEIFAIGEEKFDLLRNMNFISFEPPCSHDDCNDIETETNQSFDKNMENIFLIKGRTDKYHNHSEDDMRFDDATNSICFPATGLMEKSKQYDYDDSNSSYLKLSSEEQAMLSGNDPKTTLAQTLALRTIARVTSISKQITRLIPVKSAHIDAVTFIGEGGLRFVEKLVELNGKVAVPTTLNSQSVDRRRWMDLGVNKEFASKANRVGDAYLKLGCQLSFTCAPYLIEKNRPSLGENIMWGESNAVVYANSVIGARTEKYADYFDICAALIGKVPLVGAHLNENRKPGIILDARNLVAEAVLNHKGDFNSFKDIDSFFPTMGWLCGQLSSGKVPLILGFDQIAGDIIDDHLKAFCAAYGTTGTSPLFHMAGVTPEAIDHVTVADMLSNQHQMITVVLAMTDLHNAYQTLNSSVNEPDRCVNQNDKSSVGKIDLVALGNPHLSVSELKRLTEHVDEDQRPKHDGVKVIATLSRHVHSIGSKLGYIKRLEDFGVTFVNDTCWCMMVDEPIIPSGEHATIMTNSGKYAHYGPGLTGRRFQFGSMVECVNVLKDGRQNLNNCKSEHFPSWLKHVNTRTFFSLVKRIK